MMPCFLWNLHVFFKQDDCRLYVMSQEINVSQSRFKCKLQALIKSKKMRVRSIFFFFPESALMHASHSQHWRPHFANRTHTHKHTDTHLWSVFPLSFCQMSPYGICHVVCSLFYQSRITAAPISSVSWCFLCMFVCCSSFSWAQFQCQEAVLNARVL